MKDRAGDRFLSASGVRLYLARDLGNEPGSVAHDRQSLRGSACLHGPPVSQLDAVCPGIPGRNTEAANGQMRPEVGFSYVQLPKMIKVD